MNSTKKSKLDFGSKLFGLPAESHALPGQVDEGHALPGQVDVGHALLGQTDVGHALPAATFGGKALQGHAQLGAIVKKNQSGPAYGRMGHVSTLRFIVGAAVGGGCTLQSRATFLKTSGRGTVIWFAKKCPKNSFVWKEFMGIQYFSSKVIEFHLL